MHFHLLLMTALVHCSLVQAHNFVAVSFSQTDEIVCPNGWKCDDESTCCQLPDGDWGCCVFKNAQCCSDHTHCCPPGMECDVQGRKCKAKNTNQTIPAVETKRRSMFPSASIQLKDKATVGMTCPDRSICPLAHSACCRHFTGAFTCCNYPNNVCCDGGTHCCPVGTVCDPIYFTCYTSSPDGEPLEYGWASVVMPPTHTPARPSTLKLQDNENNVDVKRKSTFVCPDGNKCCVGQNGNYGRCIIDDPEAVCCSDGLHCCPQGSKCDATSGQCLYDRHQRELVPWSTHVTSSGTNVDQVPCPDGSSECPDGNTCCAIGGSKWGCCPMPSATCCDDKEHCCPHGTRCAPGGGCVTHVQSRRIPWSPLIFQ